MIARVGPGDRVVSVTTSAARLLRLLDVAEICQVSLRTVQGWVAAGRLRAMRLGGRVVRVEEAALEQFLSRAREDRP